MKEYNFPTIGEFVAARTSNFYSFQRPVKVFLCFTICLGGLHFSFAASGKPCPNLLRPQAIGQWTWKDRNGSAHSRADLDQVLSRHQEWLKKYALYLGSDQGLAQHGALKDPLRADLSGSVLMYADLPASHLEYADLSGTNLFMVNLAGADLYHAKLDHVSSPTCLVGADLRFTDFTGADLSVVNMTAARLDYASLTGKVNLWSASLRFADLSSANLSDANLEFADLTDAQLKGTDLQNADLRFAQLWNTVFEPKTLPAASTIARSNDLRTLRWETQNGESRSQSLPGMWEDYLCRYREQRTNAKLGFWGTIGNAWRVLALQVRQHRSKPDPTLAEIYSGVCPSKSGVLQTGVEALPDNPYPILDLRKLLHDAGYRAAELDVNLAYQRRIQSTWQMVLLDWTCEWGANWKRPIGIAALLGILCAMVYWSLIRFTRRNLLFVTARLGVREKRVQTPNPYTRPAWLPQGAMVATATRAGRISSIIWALWNRTRWEARVVSTAVLFSAMSVLNLGIQGLDVGRWVRLIHRREFDLQARGTIRLMAGIQSILSFLLLALAALSYFGQPFE